MNLKQIETKALNLTENERAKLAQSLLLSLDTPSNDEIANNWLIEARHRAKEIDDGITQPIPAEEVRRKAKILLR